MCVIIWSPRGEIPKKHVLTAMLYHQDGWGFAVPTKHGISTYRSVDHKHFLTAWVNRLRGPVLFHARWATHGKVCKANCHPFQVRRHKLVAAHNGVIHGFGSNNKSDTKHFIEEVIEPLPPRFHEEEAIMASLEDLLGSNKMVLLHHSGSATILNERLGVWKGGCWYSNTTAF